MFCFRLTLLGLTQANVLLQLDRYTEMLLGRAAELEEAAKIIRSQLPHRNLIWMKHVATQNIGEDVSRLVHNIRRHESTAQRREPTWAPPQANRSERFRAQDIMGYQLRGA
jgi:hypothetical protein